MLVDPDIFWADWLLKASWPVLASGADPPRLPIVPDMVWPGGIFWPSESDLMPLTMLVPSPP